MGTVDVIGIALDGDRARGADLPAARREDDRPLRVHPENVEGHDVATVLEAFALEYYGSAPSVPPQIIVPREAGDTSALAEFLSERRGSRVEVRPAERGEKRRLQELADQNAKVALEADTAKAETSRLRRIEALEELRETLKLESLPLRIELRRLQHPGGVAGRVDGGLPRRAEEGPFGSSGSASRTEETTMPRSPRRSRAASPGWPPPRARSTTRLRLGLKPRRHRRGRGSCLPRSRRCRRTTCRGWR